MNDNVNIITTKQKAIRIIEEVLKCLRTPEYTSHEDCVDDLRTAAEYIEQTQEQSIPERLEYLRGEIEAERISYGEIAELQSLKKYIKKDDVVLLQWAGVPEKEAYA